MGTFHEEAGKGSWKRPAEVDSDTFRSNWDAIFSKKLIKEPKCIHCEGTGTIYDAGWEYDCICKQNNTENK